ncbi:Sterol desaturase/sphingolipid hydroxylase, fatty acid hydroxylase superfamily [Chitinophaga jiangningensis]|uniref:Sterol desaturase/sphingolipid hydroxylase, fatty acid hydroxylase superfamily n=1 Tax=Chitinophaga jiangningensis TaxID=1419482 RepID=A0A1M7AQ14_9BACT|nr:sterol desaturase family protein [Chitinophaga jiangningensis]SHL44755.1 Sterol desaturase/sphingolipid hydroxylase, fatty acid hydroxylase superfamily [Chitinophaga jiangningensis]
MDSTLPLILGKMQGVFGYVVLGLVVLEWVILVLTRKMESNREGWVNIFSYVLDSIPPIFLGKILIFGTMMWLYEYRLFTLGYAWYIWILAYFVYDFMFWLIHYLGHKVRFFWCIHGVHHTAEEMKLTVAVRGSFLGILHMPLTILGLPLLGFDPFMLFIVEAIARLYGLYEHVNDHFDDIVGKQRWLEVFFVTPSIHRVHHAKNLIYLDRNYGETFSIWDRIFGTFQSEVNDVKPEYGLLNHHINSKNLWQVQVGLWKDLWQDVRTAPGWKNKLRYLVMPPGWNHYDGGKLAAEYREEGWQQLKAKQSRKPVTQLNPSA